MSPSPFGGCVVIEERAVIPAKAGIHSIRNREFVRFFGHIFKADARLRGHDELRHGLLRERVGVRVGEARGERFEAKEFMRLYQ